MKYATTLLSAPFALLTDLAMALLLKNIASDNVRQAAMLVSIPVTYMLAGGALVNALRSERQENLMAYDFMALCVRGAGGDP